MWLLPRPTRGRGRGSLLGSGGAGANDAPRTGRRRGSGSRGAALRRLLLRLLNQFIEPAGHLARFGMLQFVDARLDFGHGRLIDEFDQLGNLLNVDHGIRDLECVRTRQGQHFSIGMLQAVDNGLHLFQLQVLQLNNAGFDLVGVGFILTRNTHVHTFPVRPQLCRGNNLKEFVAQRNQRHLVHRQHTLDGVQEFRFGKLLLGLERDQHLGNTRRHDEGATGNVGVVIEDDRQRRITPTHLQQLLLLPTQDGKGLHDLGKHRCGDRQQNAHKEQECPGGSTGLTLIHGEFFLGLKFYLTARAPAQPSGALRPPRSRAYRHSRQQIHPSGSRPCR